MPAQAPASNYFLSPLPLEVGSFFLHPSDGMEEPQIVTLRPRSSLRSLRKDLKAALKMSCIITFVLFDPCKYNPLSGGLTMAHMSGSVSS